MTTDEKLDFLLSDMQGMKANMATKDDIQELKLDISELKKQGNDTFGELMKVESVVIKLQDEVSDLSDKYNTLLLKSDNTALLLKLIDKQADEVTTLKARMDAVEQKLA